ncbi:MAG: tetratricopeptide repeat protein [Clostridia bacterium]|nr:tetratricopeptide repeat protein [Clostridia bacterium]
MLKKWLPILLALVLIASTGFARADSFSDMLEKAEAYLASGDADRALTCCQLAKMLQPDNTEVSPLEAEAHLLKGDPDAAETIISTLLADDPMSAEAWLLQCRADMLRLDTDAFEEHVLFAEVCGADLSAIAASAAVMYEQTGDPEKAQAYRILAGESADPKVPDAIAKSTLDEAFDANALTLQQTEFPLISADDFDIPDAFWTATGQPAPKNPIAVLEARLAEADPYWLSLSPAGDSGLIAANDMLAISCYEGKYHILYPSVDRGVPDEYGNLARFLQTPISRLLGNEGLVYSPDGRYAAVMNVQSTVVNARFDLDPIVIDLATGEVILTATYPNKMMQEGTGAVTAGCFSADSRTFYYMTYQTGNDFMTCLYRCDLETLQTEVCGSFSDYTYWPGLFETPDGALIILRDANRQMDSAGIARMEQRDGAWHYDTCSYALSMKYWNANRLLYSPASGIAVVLARPGSLSSEAFAFLCVKPDEGFDGLDRHIVIASDGSLLCLDAQALAASVETWAEEIRSGQTAQASAPYQTILNARLSPDGQYLLLRTLANAEDASENEHLYLVRLSSLEIREIKGLESSLPSLPSYFPPMIEWNADLIMETADGVQAFRFE